MGRDIMEAHRTLTTREELDMLEREFYAVMHDFDDDPILLDEEIEAQIDYLIMGEFGTESITDHIDYLKITKEVTYGVEDISQND